MWSCHLFLIWTFDSCWFDISVTRSWIFHNMKSFFLLSFFSSFFFFKSLQPYWEDPCRREQSKEKKLQGPEIKMIRKKKGDGLEEKPLRAFCSFYVNLLIWGVVRCSPLRAALNNTKNRSGRENSSIRLQQVLCFLYDLKKRDRGPDRFRTQYVIVSVCFLLFGRWYRGSCLSTLMSFFKGQQPPLRAKTYTPTLYASMVFFSQIHTYSPVCCQSEGNLYLPPFIFRHLTPSSHFPFSCHTKGHLAKRWACDDMKFNQTRAGAKTPFQREEIKAIYRHSKKMQADSQLTGKH